MISARPMTRVNCAGRLLPSACGFSRTAVSRPGSRLTGATKLYPRPGMLVIKRLPPRPSRNALRSAATWTRRAPSSTAMSGQARAMSCSFVTVSPARSVSAAKISSARLPRCTGFPSSDSMRCAGIKRNDPKVKASSSIGQSLPEASAIGTDRGGFSQARGDRPAGGRPCEVAPANRCKDAFAQLHNR